MKWTHAIKDKGTTRLEGAFRGEDVHPVHMYSVLSSTEIEIDALVFFLLSHGTSITKIYAQTRSSVETRAQEIRPGNNTESLALTAKIKNKIKHVHERRLSIDDRGGLFFRGDQRGYLSLLVKLEAKWKRNQVNPHPWTKKQ